MSKREENGGPEYSENPKSGDAGPTVVTEVNSEKPKAGEATSKDPSKSEKPKW